MFRHHAAYYSCVPEVVKTQLLTGLHVSLDAAILRSVSLGGNIRIARERAGLSQKEGAERLDLPQPRLNDLEAGRYKRMRTDTLLKIAVAFNCSVEDLLRGVHPRYDLQRKEAARSLTPRQVWIQGFEDPDLLQGILDRWPETSPRGHRTARDVMDGFPVQREDSAPPSRLTSDGQRLARKTSEKK